MKDLYTRDIHKYCCIVHAEQCLISILLLCGLALTHQQTSYMYLATEVYQMMAHHNLPK